MVIKSIFIFLYTLLNLTLKRTTFFNRILIALNLASAVIYLKYPTEVSNLIIPNNKSISFHFLIIFIPLHFNSSYYIPLFNYLLYNRPINTRKAIRYTQFSILFYPNNIITSILLKGILNLFYESYLESGQCYGSPCVLNRSCAF